MRRHHWRHHWRWRHRHRGHPPGLRRRRLQLHRSPTRPLLHAPSTPHSHPPPSPAPPRRRRRSPPAHHRHRHRRRHDRCRRRRATPAPNVSQPAPPAGRYPATGPEAGSGRAWDYARAVRCVCVCVCTGEPRFGARRRGECGGAPGEAPGLPASRGRPARTPHRPGMSHAMTAQRREHGWTDVVAHQ